MAVDDAMQANNTCMPDTSKASLPRSSVPRPVPSSWAWGGEEWMSMPTRSESSEGGMDRRAGSAGRAKEEGYKQLRHGELADGTRHPGCEAVRVTLPI